METTCSIVANMLGKGRLAALIKSLTVSLGRVLRAFNSSMSIFSLVLVNGLIVVLTFMPNYHLSVWWILLSLIPSDAITHGTAPLRLYEMSVIVGDRDNNRFIVQVFVGALSLHYEALSVEASKQTTSEEIVVCIVERLKLQDSAASYELAEVVGDGSGEEGKERRLGPAESPVQLMLLWPKTSHNRDEHYRFYLREKDGSWNDNFSMDPDLIRDYLFKFLYQPKDREYPDLCQLPDLNEQTLLDNLRARFLAGHIYTYVGSILIALNPFKFHPIYNPKYVKLYQNCRLGSKLPPHIFAVADAAYHSMLKEKRNQCVVISGESGSGKTESTNFLLHHLTALSQKGSHGSGVEQTILSAGPVLEAFGNAKTAHNNNSSRFGKFIQVNYKENGMVHGAVVQKYLLEKSRICSQARNERNYHVFYYLLVGATDMERSQLNLLRVQDYNYLNQSGCFTLDNVDEKHEFSRLKQSMEMVGFNMEKQRRLFSVLSAVLLLGNVEFQPRKVAYHHHDEAVSVSNPDVVLLISELLKVRQETLLAALCTKRAKASGETLIINYRMREAAAGRDAMAKCLYGALFDWIVLQLNHALLSKKDTLGHHQGHSIGVLDIFGFEDFGHCNSFEQLCINYANEHLQFYFNQHVFKYEQQEYRKEGIKWSDIDFMDNTGCLQLFEAKPHGMLCILDDQCNFPGATNETLIQKFNSVHKDNEWYEMPPRRETAFIIRHYAGRVKYQVVDLREKNLDLMRQDIVGVLKNSSMAFVRELVGADPVAVFRWAIVRAFFRGYFAFHEAGRRYRQSRADGHKTSALQQRFRNQSPNDSLVSHLVTVSAVNYTIYRIARRKGSSLMSPVQHSKAERSPASPQHRSPVKQDGGDHVRIKLILFEGANRSQVMEKANQIVMKNKSFRPRDRGKKGLKNLQSVKTLAGRTQSLGAVGGAGKRKQPLTVTAQFQLSLHSLMDTLNMANPFFIRCIKSNGHKISNKFDDETVQRQLRYTGMLETVRIRQAGFNVRLSYDEFIQIYRILLVKGLLSSQADVKYFLSSLNLNRDNYQLGGTKIFLRETEKIKLDYRLHQQIMAAIVTVQRWFRACLDRRRFLKWRDAALVIQSSWRCVLAQRLVAHLRENAAATRIQAWYKGMLKQRWYLALQTMTTRLQARIRGLLVRRCVAVIVNRRTSSQLSVSASHLELSKEDNFPLRPARSNQEVRTVIAVGDPNSIAPRKKKLSQRRSHEDRTMAPATVDARRKGSCDSLTSQKSADSTGIPVKDTLSKAKKQLQALLRGGKKTEKWESSLQTAHSDGELDENNQNGRYSNWYQGINNNEDGNREFKSDESLDSVGPHQVMKHSPVMDDYNDNVWQARCDVQRHQVLRRSPASAQDPKAPARLARKSRPSPRPESYSFDLVQPPSPPNSENITISISVPCRDDSVVERTCSEPVRPPRDHAPLTGATDDSLTRDDVVAVFKRTSSDPTRPSSETFASSSEPLRKEGERRFSGLDAGSDVLEWNGRRTMFTISGHRFRKVSRFSNQDRCAFCKQSMDPIVTQGHKCSDCKVLFHTKCIQNGGVLQMPCKRKQARKDQRVQDAKSNKFALTGTSEFTDSTDKIVSDVTELRKMQSFIADKMFKMESEGNQQRNSEVDRVFRQALKEFKDNLVATYSIANRQGDSLNIKYKDLISNFTQAMKTVCSADCAQDISSVTMGVNAFRGFMNEFMAEQQQHAEKPKDKKRKKEKKRSKPDEMTKFRGHVYLLTMINIPTACEVCNSFFMWPLERSLVCQNCKFTCHKKCHTKLAGSCRASEELMSDNRIFGVPLQRLATDGKVPLVVDRLITNIEMHGLYTEGIYRKPGVMPRVKELKARMESTPSEQVRFEDYPVHVLASVLKSFFREMPEPLLTSDCYEDFLRATALTDPADRISTLFSILKKLPKPNFDLMERLIFHLARVASQEESNRMSASALAIVFAPCILRTNKIVPAQDSLQDISKQTHCIETIISEQLRKVRSTLADIDTLDSASHSASHRLSSLRSSKIFSPEDFHGGSVGTVSSAEPEDEDAEMLLLEDHIQEIEKEKALLTSTLPSLTRTTSDDDLLSTDMDDGSLDDNTYCGSRVSQEDAIMV